MLGFWMLFFLYPLNGIHHYVFSVIPMDAQMGSIAASALLGVNVILVVANLLLSARGSGWLQRDLPLRFAVMSAVLYLVVSIQGSLQAQMSINQEVHFSDWVIGHSHLAMLGFATFAAAAGLTHAWQRIPEARFSRTALAWSYWLLLGGMLMMVGQLTAAGLEEGRVWRTTAPWLDSVRAVKGFWLVRTLMFVPVTAGFVALLVAITTGDRGKAEEKRMSATGVAA
jgi:cbb3-type cytochrome oxidase subunit 1